MTLPAVATDAIGRTLRHDGWTPERQRVFIESIAQGHTITDACKLVGLSQQSAYGLRDRAAGAAFAIGWAAAALRARGPLADQLHARALHGQTEWHTRADGSQVERFRYDNGLATRLLARLDAQVALPCADQAAAHAAAGEFEAYLDLLGRGESPQPFLARRAVTADQRHAASLIARADRYVASGAGLPNEVATHDLDPAARQGWTVEQWHRADAAGVVRIEAGPQERQFVAADEDQPVWWDEDANDWRTSFPPPPGFDGHEDGIWGENQEYARALSDDEHDLVDDDREDELDAACAEACDARDRWFAAKAAALDRADEAAADGEEDGRFVSASDAPASIDSDANQPCKREDERLAADPTGGGPSHRLSASAPPTRPESRQPGRTHGAMKVGAAAPPPLAGGGIGLT